MKVVFALFAEDAELLPEKLVENILKQARKKPETAKVHLEKLFAAMRDGDESGVKFTAEIAHFNGGLFEDTSSLDLEADDLDILLAAAKLDWSSVDPAIFGNLYEYGLGAESRAKRGVHYTSREDILHLIEPVLLRPWRQRWETLREEVVKGLEGKASGKALGILKQRVEAFREALGQVQVLDPACGSGNFLVVAMQRLMDLELEVVRFQAARFHIQALSFHVGPQQLHGIELLAFPHALASVVVWIGHLQWLHQHRYSIQERPILKKLQPIVQGDSLLLDWPKVDAIIGNPPFIGSKRLRSALGDATVDNLFKDWDGRVPREADYVCYWFEKAREAVVAGRAERVGLLATNSLRQGKNRVVVDRILADTSIFFAESDRDWTLKGAAVRVSMVGFGAMEAGELRVLDGQVVETINPNLTSASDFSRAKRLKENAGLSFMGDTKGAPFDIPGDLARDWLAAPSNPNGRPNSDVLKPWANGMDITRRPQDRWIIDFGMGALKAGQAPVPGMLHLPEAELCYYVEPYNYAMSRVKPAWAASKTGSRREWFVHAESRPALRGSIAALPRFLVTTRHAKHRIFEWLPGGTIPDSALIAFATDQDGFFGVLQSRVHDLWAVAQGSFLGVGNDSRYTPNTTFETFPFPSGFHVSPPDALALAARRLHEKRGAWLNPAGADSVTLASRTLTALYNSREAGQAKATWLNDLHRELDRSVLAAYGWSDLAEPLFQAEDALRAANPNGEALGLPLTRTPAGQAILGRLLELNQARVSK
jgi:type II restriction/modification system DNA methylase subunit YeeA